MNGFDIVVIALSLVSLLCSLLSAIFSKIVSDESKKMKDEVRRKKEEAQRIKILAKARAASRVEVPEESFVEIMDQSKEISEDSYPKIIKVPARRVFQETSTKIANS